jgi:Lysophospholipase L1 and related esterases
MVIANTWLQEFSNYSNIDDVNKSGHQTMEVFEPMASKKLRFLLNNKFGKTPLEITAMTAHTDLQDVKITLRGNEDFLIEPRQKVWSDWIDIDVPGRTFLTVDIYSPNKTIHTLGSNLATSFTRVDNHQDEKPRFYFGLSSVEAQLDQDPIKIGFFGDSLMDQGYFTAPVAKDLSSLDRIVTANYGISGNRLLHPGNTYSEWAPSFGNAGIVRFDDMIHEFQPNLVVFMEGLNDLMHPGAGSPMTELPTTQELIDGIDYVAKKCHDRNIIFAPMTVTPFKGDINEGIHSWTPQKEVIRQEFNKYIMETFVYSIDLAPFVSDNSQLRLAKEFDSGDHTHFSKEGGEKIARFVIDELLAKHLVNPKSNYRKIQEQDEI